MAPPEDRLSSSGSPGARVREVKNPPAMIDVPSGKTATLLG